MGSLQTKSCYIVDADAELRDSLIALLGGAGFEARGFATTVEFLSASPQLPPAPVILDLRIPGPDGLDHLERSGDRFERFAVIMTSDDGDLERAVRSIKAGALDVLEKPFRPDDLMALLEAAQEALDSKLDRSAQRHDAEAKIAHLSPRELEVLRLLLKGVPNKVAARALDLSVRTIEMHRAHMLAKLAAKSTAEALHLAMLAKVQPWP